MRRIDATIKELRLIDATMNDLRPVIREEVDAALVERMGDPNRYLSVQQAAEVLGVGPHVLYDAIQAGRLQGLKVGRQYRFTMSDLQAWGQTG